MLLLKGFVLVRQKELDPEKEPDQALIFGKPSKVLEYSPLEFVPFGTISGALASLEYKVEHAYWDTNVNHTHLIYQLEMKFPRNPEEERNLGPGPWVVFHRGRHTPKYSCWSVAGERNDDFLLSLEPYQYVSQALRNVEEVRKNRGVALLAHWRWIVAWDSKLDPEPKAFRAKG